MEEKNKRITFGPFILTFGWSGSHGKRKKEVVGVTGCL